MARPGVQKHLDIAELLRCPLCGAEMHARQSSVVCESGHDFAISAKGFLNLIPHQKPLKGYDETFFASRQRIMEHGYYREVHQAVAASLNELASTATVIDAGCGEGSYAKDVARALPHSTVLGLDIAKDAIRVAARGGGPVRWLVADLANIPLSDSTVDAILNVFTPANYDEFKRVLKPGGMLVKVIPAPQHMHELRELAGEQLSEADFIDHGVSEHLMRHMNVVSRARVTQTSPVQAEDALDLVRMSPVAFSIEEHALDLDSLTHITVDAEIICAQFTFRRDRCAKSLVPGQEPETRRSHNPKSR